MEGFMKIAITQEIIDEANRLRDGQLAPSSYCPVALAIKAAVKPGTYVAVGNWNAYIGEPLLPVAFFNTGNEKDH